VLATHCKPWRDSTNEGRLNGKNGLLLTPSIDHLFDRGFIRFEDSGKQEAAQFLSEFSGSEFQFVTALTVINSQTRKKLSAVETSTISFRQLVETEIRDYITTYDVLRYAGAFESEAVLRFADRISGSYNFVTALPVSRLVVFLRAQGVAI